MVSKPLCLVLLAWALIGATPNPPASLPKSIDTALQQPISIDADHQAFSDLVDKLRDKTQANIVINWNALAQSGIKRDTPVDLRLNNMPFEQALKTLLEILPVSSSAPAARANYTVGDNTLTISTNAELGKGSVPRITDVTHALSYTLEQSLTQETEEQNAKLLEQVLRVDLIRSGESLDAKTGHAIAIKSGTLASTLSARGQNIVDRAMLLVNAPLKIGQLAAGTQLTPGARKTQEALKALSADHARTTLAQIAANPRNFADKFNVALLPGTGDELARSQGGQTADLASAINDGGVLLIGPRELMRQRTVLAVYDLRDLIRRLNFKNTKKPQPTAAEYQLAIVQILQTSLSPTPEPEKWGGPDDLSKSPPPPSCLIPFNGLLIVFAAPETHRTLAAALQDMNK